MAFGGPAGSAARLERRAAADGVDLSRVWVAWAGQRIVASAVLAPHPGRTALLMTNAPRDTAHADSVGAVVGHALADAELCRDIRLVQSLASPDEPLRRQAFLSGGMRHLATLDYLEHPDASAVAAAEVPPGIELRPWVRTDRGMLESLLAETYRDTLDCPGLAELRTPRDIVDGHLASSGDARHWYVAWAGGTPVGAALVSTASAAGTVDLVYLGLVPPVRGTGLGRALLAHSLRAAGCERRGPASLAVDARNTPAVRLYRSIGFVSVRRRNAFVAVPAA
jgi:ribosomal protein S18 acetylase RimI-like enzyme